MARRPTAPKKPKTVHFDHILAPRPTTIERTAHTRTVSMTARGSLVVENREPPIISQWRMGPSWSVDDDREIGLDSYDANWEDDGPAVVDTTGDGAGAIAKGKRKRSQTSTRPNIVWKEIHREAYLDEILRSEGRGQFIHTSCSDCGDVQPKYRCDECNDPAMTCKACCLKRHAHNPFHIVKIFDICFRKISLKEMGLVIQLGHRSGRCAMPVKCHDDFTVLHTTGQHLVALQFCGCESATSKDIQLLRRRLYPSTQTNPQTCATFALMDFLHLLALTTKSSTLHFYSALVRLTDNTGLLTPRSCYQQLRRMSHQYRHLRLLKRGGRGHLEDGIETVSPGELALQCPTCPHKHTMDNSWEDLPQDKQFLNRFTASVDAGFKCKNLFASSWVADPGLGNGMAYMIPQSELVQHLHRNKDMPDEASTCADFDAIKHASSKNGESVKPKYRTTGVVGASCVRSEMLTPNGVGDLQHGERYVNVDIVVGHSMVAFAYLSCITISYDIVCQWLVNLWTRMAKWPEHLKLDQTRTNIRGCVPKFHYPAHNPLGHSQFSFHRVPGSATIDGECCERIWDGTNALGKTTRSMGPGTRSDTLDDHFQFWNWNKYIGIGKHIKKQYRLAVVTRNRMDAAHLGFTANMKPEHIEAWTAEIVAWEKSIEKLQPRSLKSPYDTDDATLSDLKIRLLMDAEEKQAVKDGAIRVHSIGPARFIAMGLDIEETQRRLTFDTLKTEGETDIQRSSILERRNALTLRVAKFKILRATYLPGLPLYTAHLAIAARLKGPIALDSDLHTEKVPVDAERDDFPESENLFLPSAIPEDFRARVCIPETIDAEIRLRIAQLTDFLINIRRCLRIRQKMIHWKNHNISGQHHGTRSRGIIDRMQARLNVLVKAYRVARIARLKLQRGDWELVWRELRDGDIKSYIDLEESVADAAKKARNAAKEARSGKKASGETRRELSWIWISTARVEASSDGKERGYNGFEGMDETLKIEWLKSRRRFLGWSEECELLPVEMRRALRFLQHKASLWDHRKTFRPTPSETLNEGLCAYAHRQSELQTRLAASFACNFADALKPANSGTSTTAAAGDMRDSDGNDDDDDDAIDLD